MKDGDGLVKVLYSLRHRHHHPEREFENAAFQEPHEHPQRAEIIRAALAGDSAFALLAPDDWGTGPIEAVHDPGLVKFLEEAWSEFQTAYGPTHDVVPDVFAMSGLRDGMGPGPEPEAIGARLGWWCFETTTPLTHGTYDAARSAVDVALSTWGHVEAGERAAYGLCRPPGHHATRSLYGGYCFFNNAAVVAERIVSTTGSKVAIIDVDYHHGNGTQQIFYERPEVMFASLHGDPARAYPYHTGYADEIGAGAGRGYTLNLPLPERLDDAGYLESLGRIIDAVDVFDPAVIVVSLGVDTYFEDPISDLGLTTDGMFRSGAAIAALDRPTVVLQEGGYADEALGENVRLWLRGLMGADPDDALAQAQ